MSKATIHGFVVERAENLTEQERQNNRKWVEALRSGQYEQGQYELRTDEGYCCLGVAEDVLGCFWESGPTHLYAKRVLTNSTETSFNILTDFARSELGLPAGHNAGITVVKDQTGIYYNLTELNDGEGLTFAQIADIVAFWAGVDSSREEGSR